MQKAPKSGDLSPLNSVQLLRENISHKQTLTKTCHANICFLSRFFMQKSLSRYSRNLHRSFKYFNIRTQSVLPWSQWKTKYQPSKFIFHSPRGIQILILGNAIFQFLGHWEYICLERQRWFGRKKTSHCLSQVLFNEVEEPKKLLVM